MQGTMRQTIIFEKNYYSLKQYKKIQWTKDLKFQIKSVRKEKIFTNACITRTLI